MKKSLITIDFTHCMLF